MGCKTRRHDFFIRVEPVAAGDYGFVRLFSVERTEKEEETLCNRIAEQIRRHVDEVSAVRLGWETEATCEFCGARWTEGKDAPHNGGCCDQDAAAMPDE